MKHIKAALKVKDRTEIINTVTINPVPVQIETAIEPLTDTEQQRLEEYEAVFEESKDAFLKGYEALQHIKDERLFRTTHKTFKEYAMEKFGLTDRHVNRLLLASSVVEDIKRDQLVSSIPVAIPENEAQSRPLQALTPPQRIEAARIVAQKLSKPTAKDFQEATDEVTGKVKTGNKTTKSVTPAPINRIVEGEEVGGTDTKPIATPHLKDGEARIVLITKPKKDLSQLQHFLDRALDCVQTGEPKAEIIHCIEDALKIVNYFANQLATPDEDVSGAGLDKREVA
jgi:hypothetical protein